MAELEYFLLSDSISTDQATNQLSLFHIIEDVTLPLSTRIPRLVASSSWNMHPDEMGDDFQVVLRIYHPNGDLLDDPGDIPINFTAERSRHRLHHEVRGLPIEVAGDWRFEVLLNGKRFASHTVTIHASDTDA